MTWASIAALWVYVFWLIDGEGATRLVAVTVAIGLGLTVFQVFKEIGEYHDDINDRW